MRKMTLAALSGAAGLGLVVSGLPANPAMAAQTVPPALFGQHVSRIVSETPAGLHAGAIRLWDSGVAWRDLEPSDNGYNWSKLDSALAHAKAIGVSEILYTMGGTPGWAATNPNSSGGLYGPGTNSTPKSSEIYVDFIRDLLAHSRSVGVPITAVQIWNEANLPDFYNGTPAQMAALTKAAAPTIRAGGATVVAASTTVRAGGPTKTWGKNYGKAMRAVGWPVDAVAGHFYPPATKGPATRVGYIKALKKYYKKWGAGSKPIWDTEMNYGDSRSYMQTKKQYEGATAATYVARTYIDSMRYNIKRVFWYGWDIAVLGTDMTTRPGMTEITAGGQAFLQVQKWMAGNTWYGCSVKGKVTKCSLSANGQRQAIVFASKTTSYKLPAGTSSIKNLSGGTSAGSAGQKITLTTQPILLVGA
ncbi:MAG: hypothetical protein ACOYEV_00340 [Candidatus Nanopelagicales bacterium]